MTVPIDRFVPVATPAPDWSAAGNWSGGVVPAAGMAAAIDGMVAMIDPGVTIAADLALTGLGTTAAALIGNGGAIVFGASSALSIGGSAAVYAEDSVVNQGIIMAGAASSLAIVVDLGALSGLTGAAPPSFANQGTIALSAGAVIDIGGTAFDNAGLVTLAGGTLEVTGGALAGSGTIALSGGAVVSLGDGVADQRFDFGTGGAALTLADPVLASGITIEGFARGDTIALPSLADARIGESGGFVTIWNDAGAVQGSFAFAGSAQLAAVMDGSGSAIVAVQAAAPNDPPCFVRGTAILTPAGDRPVEQLAAGDMVVTADGGLREVIWTGLRHLELATHPAPATVQPIRIEAGALGPGVPRRALLVSPDHAIYLDGVLIPAKLLVNDATIVRQTACLAVTYHHIELSRHDVLLAEGAPCESYLDTGNRAGFAGTVAVSVRPKRWDRDACARLITAGATLRGVRTRLHERAAALGFIARHDSRIGVWVDGRKLASDAAGRFAVPLIHGGRAVIRSARFCPAAFDPGSEDRRHLGIALASLRAGRRRFRPDDLADGGFHPRADGDAALWTDGAGSIRLPAGARSIALDLAAVPLAWVHVGSAH